MFVEKLRGEDINPMANYVTGSAPSARGVRKINEQTVQEGRALIITEENESNYSWEDIPCGSLKVDGDTGVILVKLRGQGSWVPSNIRIDTARDINGEAVYDTNDTEFGHTVAIAKDSIILRENYVITNTDSDGNRFTYEDETGQRFFGYKSEKGFHFELRKGHYAPGRNMLDVIIDDCLYRSAASGGIIEQSETKFIVTEPLVNGMELTVKYVQLIRYGNPYPRIYLRRGQYNDQGIDMNDEPENAEVGDVWIDFTGEPEDEDGYLAEALNSSDYIPWWRISGFPTTVSEAQACNFMKDAVAKGHRHKISDIDGFSDIASGSSSSGKVMSAVSADRASYADEAGNSLKLQGKTFGTGKGDIVQVQQTGKIASNILPSHSHKVYEITMDDGVTSLVQGIADRVSSNVFVRGMTIPFYGDKIPNGWAECNGQNGTPNLSEYLISGVGSYVVRYIMKL